MIFPSMGPKYIDQGDGGIIGLMQQFYSDACPQMQAFWAEADTNNRFYVGDQNAITNIYGGTSLNYRRNFNFNRIRRAVSTIDGNQRQNRKSTIVVPIENGDSITADQFTKVMLWIYNRNNIPETFSDGFRSALVSGMSLMQTWIDYRSDPINGDIKVDMCPYNTFIIDPYFRKHDLSDCRSLWKRSYVTKRQALSLLPNQEDLIANLAGSWTNGDARFQFMPESMQTSYKNLLTYDEFYYADYREQKLLVDTQSGDTMEWRRDDNDALRDFLQQYPQIKLIEQDIPTVRLAIVLQGRLAYDGSQPTGLDTYPFVPIFCYWNPQMGYYQDKIQSMVTDLRSPQWLYNHRRIIEFDILESQPNSGWIYKEDSLVNPADVYKQIGQGKGIALKAEAQMTDVQQIQPAQIPPSMMEISNSLAREINEIAGINEELQGNASKDVAGFLAAMRANASLTTYQGIFDQLDLSQKLLGEKILEMVQINFTPGKIKNILGGEEPSPEFYNKNFGKYNCVIEEGLNTITQRQMAFAQILQLREAGVPIPDSELLEFCTLQNKAKIIEQIQQSQQQQQQMQMQKAQMDIQEVQARIDLAHARSTADQGLGIERMSRVQENQALAEERRAEARKDDDLALLNKAKALKELDSIDIDHLHRLIALAKMLEADTKRNEEKPSSSGLGGEEVVDRGINLAQ